jgi:hypothetical protein
MYKKRRMSFDQTDAALNEGHGQELLHRSVDAGPG